MSWYKRLGKGSSIAHYLSEYGTDALADLESVVTKLRDKTITKAEKERLFFGHLRLAIHTASSYTSHYPNKTNELVSEAVFGLLMAIERSPDKLTDNNFTYYAVSCVHSAIRRFLERDRLFRFPCRTYTHYKKLNKSIFHPKIVNIEMCLDPVRKLYKLREISPKKNRLKEIRDRLDEAIKTETERKIIDLREQRYKDAEIGKLLGMSHTKVFQLRQRVKKRYLKLEQLDSTNQ